MLQKKVMVVVMAAAVFSTIIGSQISSLGGASLKTDTNSYGNDGDYGDANSSSGGDGGQYYGDPNRDGSDDQYYGDPNRDGSQNEGSKDPASDCKMSGGFWNGKFCEFNQQGDQFGGDDRDYEEGNYRGDDNYGDNSNVMEDQTNSGMADSKDVERQKKDLERMLKDHNRSIKDFDRLTKNVERIQKDLDKKIEKAAKLTEKKGSSDLLKDLVKILKERKEITSEIAAEIPSTVSAYKQAISDYQTSIQGLSSGTTTWDQMNGMWDGNRKLEKYRFYRSAFELPINFIEMENEINDMTIEIAKIKSDYEASGSSLPEEIDGLIKKIEDLRDLVPQSVKKYEEFKSKIAALGDSADEDTMMDLRDYEQDINSFRQDTFDVWNEWRESEPWKNLDGAFQKGGQMKEMGNIKGELEFAKKIIGAAGELVKNVKTTDSKVQEALKTLDALNKKAMPILEVMFQKLAEEKFDEMESLGVGLEDIGDVLEKSLEVVVSFCKQNSASCGNVDLGIFEQDMKQQPKGDYKGMDYKAELGDEYMEEELINKLADKIFKKVQEKMKAELPAMFGQMFNEASASKIVAYMESNFTVDKMLNGVFDNVDNLGSDKVKEVVDNSTEVYDEAAGIKDLEGATQEAKDLIAKVEGTMIASTVKEELVTKLQELKDAIDNGKNTSGLVTAIKQLLEKNRRDLALVDKVEFLDVTAMENQWYYGPVMKGAGQGIFSGDAGKGTFRPGDNMVRAEALKVFLEAAGQGQVPGSYSNWYDGYVAKAKELGLSIANQNEWGSPITRGELARLMVELGGFTLETYSGQFPDVDSSDEYADVAATMSGLGIIKGTGEGKFNGKGSANRAEVAAMVTRFLDATQTSRVIDDLDKYNIENTEKNAELKDFSDVELEDEDVSYAIGIGKLRL